MSEVIRIQSIDHIHKLFGLPSPKHPLITVLPIDEKMLSYNYGEYTYLFDLYQVSMKSGIEGSMGYGRKAYDFNEGTMVFTKPGQAIKVSPLENYEEANGWTLIFHPDLLLKSALSQRINQYSFFSYETAEALHLSTEEQNTLKELVSKIEKELDSNIDRHSQDLMIGNIGLILDYCTRYFDRQFYTRSNFNKDHIADFERLLDRYFSEELTLEYGLPTIAHFGDKMNMSGHYLSDLLRKETGMSAQDHIYRKLINKAKSLLIGSNDSVAQVAYHLGFEYPNHFSKLFKSKTGMSPNEFRKSA